MGFLRITCGLLEGFIVVSIGYTMALGHYYEWHRALSRSHKVFGAYSFRVYRG